MRTCLNKQCCEMRYKQPIGELIMTCIMCIVYFGTIVGVMLPKIDEFLDPKKTVSKQLAESILETYYPCKKKTSEIRWPKRLFFLHLVMSYLFTFSGWAPIYKQTSTLGIGEQCYPSIDLFHDKSSSLGWTW